MALLALGWGALALGYRDSAFSYMPVGWRLLVLLSLSLLAWPLVAATEWLVAAVARRRPRRFALLAGATLLGALVFTFLTLQQDAASMDPEQHYSWAGWYVALLPGAWGAGVLFLAGYVLRAMYRLLRGLWRSLRRHRQSGARPAAA
jgi:hypothetical protein